MSGIREAAHLGIRGGHHHGSRPPRGEARGESHTRRQNCTIWIQEPNIIRVDCLISIVRRPRHRCSPQSTGSGQGNTSELTRCIHSRLDCRRIFSREQSFFRRIGLSTRRPGHRLVIAAHHIRSSVDLGHRLPAHPPHLIIFSRCLHRASGIHWRPLHANQHLLSTCAPAGTHQPLGHESCPQAHTRTQRREPTSHGGLAHGPPGKPRAPRSDKQHCCCVSRHLRPVGHPSGKPQGWLQRGLATCAVPSSPKLSTSDAQH